MIECVREGEKERRRERKREREREREGTIGCEEEQKERDVSEVVVLWNKEQIKQHLYGRLNTPRIGMGNSKSGGTGLFCLIDLKDSHCSSDALSVNEF